MAGIDAHGKGITLLDHFSQLIGKMILVPFFSFLALQKKQCCNGSNSGRVWWTVPGRHTILFLALLFLILHVRSWYDYGLGDGGST